MIGLSSWKRLLNEDEYREYSDSISNPKNIPYEEVESMEEVMSELDVLYMTRVQRERFFNEEDYIRLKDTYILNREKLQLAKEDMPVLHPLPRVDEIAYDVDDDSRAAYFQQVQNGKYMRMALILSLLMVTSIALFLSSLSL